MTEGEKAGAFLMALVDWAHRFHCSGRGARPVPPPIPAGSGLARRLARHAHDVLENGGAPVQAVDSALTMLLHSGESASLKMYPDGDPDLDPLGVRPVVHGLTDYPRRILGDAPVRPPALSNRSKNLQLMTTRFCQLRCAYCPVVKRDTHMRLETMQRATDLLLTGSATDLRLDFSGGEPLLRYDQVLRTAERFIHGAGKQGKRASFYMVTNGFLLDRNRARRLASLGFRVELSLDGPEDVHNRYKIPVDRRENPYRRTLAALEAARQADLPSTVVMVVTPDTVHSLRDSFEHAVQMGARSVDVNYAVGRYWDPDSLETYIRGLEQIIEDRGAELRDGRLQLGNISSRVEPSVLNAEWMVDTDGSVHLMTEWALESSRPSAAPDLTVGTVQEVEDWDGLYAGRFHAYESLLRSYSWRSGKLRRILFNNISSGRTVSRRLKRCIP